MRPELTELKPAAKLWRLYSRLLVSAVFGGAVTLMLFAFSWRMPTRILLGWDSGVALYLVLFGRIMAHATIARIGRRAAVDDERAIALLVLTMEAVLASLAAVIAEVRHAPSPYRLALGAGTIFLSWAFMHVVFALHYAREILRVRG